MSFCRAWAFALPLIFLSSKQSSANMSALDLTRRSLTKARNSKRSRTLPFGSPQMTGDVYELEPSSSLKRVFFPLQ